ncbi:hypothetical protein JMJ77_0014661 [Colletotrichum scovillei]|uniref:Uncharacterized protein n=1 Tax=Colletotrichum scovillei TaxID=1209932 RepID=A0A9P7R0P7_9PEZI|nr:hypothetical protein JMJ77_0014661 [Colletotrichum scovillei]KAG7056269.1 hypothetical protein JMJ78_0000073 [Colletotrichum scovillei]KAG7066199.1 hypothetical protein JMJ76_0000066 [Colletotrichum scovillei]
MVWTTVLCLTEVQQRGLHARWIGLPPSICRDRSPSLLVHSSLAL